MSRFYLYKFISVILFLLPAIFLLSKVFMVNLDLNSEIRYLPDEKVTLDQVYFFLNPISFSGFLNTFFNGGILGIDYFLDFLLFDNKDERLFGMIIGGGEYILFYMVFLRLFLIY